MWRRGRRALASDRVSSVTLACRERLPIARIVSGNSRGLVRWGCTMRNRRWTGLLVAFGAMAALALMAFACREGSSGTQEDAVQNGEGLVATASATPPPEARTPTPTLSSTQEATSTSEASSTPEPTPPPEASSTSEPTPTPEVDFSHIIFLHHSVGANLIQQGGVRQSLTDLGYEFYDHGYNDDGLTLAEGAPAGRNFDVPDDNTNPDGFADIFAQPLDDPPDNTFSNLMQYDVIAFKSCYPVSDIQSDAQLAEYRSHYLSIRARMDQYPNKIFIVVTPPPEIPADSDPQAAARARDFADWLTSGEYLDGHPNVFTFNFFDLVADPATNMLRADYRTDESDAHPNELANQTVGPLFVDFIDQSVKTYSVP